MVCLRVNPVMIVTCAFLGTGGYWGTNDKLRDGSPRFQNGDYLVSAYACDIYLNCERITHTVTVRN